MNVLAGPKGLKPGDELTVSFCLLDVIEMYDHHAHQTVLLPIY